MTGKINKATVERLRKVVQGYWDMATAEHIISNDLDRLEDEFKSSKGLIMEGSPLDEATKRHREFLHGMKCYRERKVNSILDAYDRRRINTS